MYGPPGAEVLTDGCKQCPGTRLERFEENQSGGASDKPPD